MKPLQLQLIFFASLILSLGLTPLFVRLARRWGFVDHPAHRKTHEEPVPYLGGVALFTSTLIVSFLVFGFGLNMGESDTARSIIKVFFILGATFGMVLVGLWDDVKNIRPRYKLAGQVLFALLFTLFGFCFRILHLPGLPPVHLGLLSVPVTVFWIDAVVNAFNMIDGVDCLAGTVAAGSLFLLAVASALMGNVMGLMLAVMVLGAVVGFLFYNWKPAKIYLGDAGSGGLGMFLACSLVALGQNYGQSSYNPEAKSFDQPFNYLIVLVTLLIGYPVLEIILSVFRRFLNGRPIASADRGHLHHRFLKAGWTVPEICWTALGLTFIPGLAALAIIEHQYGLAIWFLSGCGLILGLCLSTLGFLNFLKPQLRVFLRPHYQIAHHFISMQKIKLSLAATRGDVLTLVNQTCQEMGVKSYRLTVSADTRGKSGLDYSYQWNPTPHLETKTVISGSMDNVRLSGGVGRASWVFVPPTDQEELDIEYRVLISEFMREALQVAARLGKNRETLELSSDVLLPVAAISSQVLRSAIKPESQPSNLLIQPEKTVSLSSSRVPR